MRARGVVEVARRESDPFGVVPCAPAAGSVRSISAAASSEEAPAARSRAASPRTCARYSRTSRISVASVTSPCPGTTTAGCSASQLVQHVDPAIAVDVDVVGREVRDDREHARLEEVAAEQHAVVDDHHLVATGVRAPEGAQDGDVAAEVDLGRAVVDDVRIDELDALELGGDVGPKMLLEHLDVAGALAAQLVALRGGCR